MKQFYTRETANNGIKLPLSLPTGEPTDFWIRIRGVDSDEYQKAYNDSRRKLAEAAVAKDPKIAFAEIDKEGETVKLLCALIIDWNLTEEGVAIPCTDEKKRELFREAPQIADMISSVAARRSAFFKNAAVTSTSSLAASSN